MTTYAQDNGGQVKQRSLGGVNPTAAYPPDEERVGTRLRDDTGNRSWQVNRNLTDTGNVWGLVGFETGSATIDFGAGGIEATTVVTGQVGIIPSSLVIARFMADATATNDADAHAIATTIVALCCGAVVDGVGFTIYAMANSQVSGTFTVRWTWS